jgi:hypothetical protein
MMHNRKWMPVSILLSLLVLIALAVLTSLTVANSPQGNDVDYLPLVVTQPPPLGIHGRVTENGVPVPGVIIGLRLHDGLDWTTVATVTTDANAEYHFLNMPALSPGHTYNSIYLNPDNNPNRIASWIGYLITSYAAGADAAGADIDIADIQLVNPPSGAVEGLPATFTWHRRPLTTDSYEFGLFHPSGSPYFYSNPALGYVNNYTLNDLPPGFQFNTDYSWSLVAYGPGGGGETGNYGFAQSWYSVTFVKTASGVELVTAPTAPIGNLLVDTVEIER